MCNVNVKECDNLMQERNEKAKWLFKNKKIKENDYNTLLSVIKAIHDNLLVNKNIYIATNQNFVIDEIKNYKEVCYNNELKMYNLVL